MLRCSLPPAFAALSNPSCETHTFSSIRRGVIPSLPLCGDLQYVQSMIWASVQMTVSKMPPSPRHKGPGGPAHGPLSRTKVRFLTVCRHAVSILFSFYESVRSTLGHKPHSEACV